MRFDDDDDHNANSLATSQSSDAECGSVFASSAYGHNDDDSPPLMRRQTTSSGENNRDFELIEREIGMCRPVGLLSLHRWNRIDDGGFSSLFHQKPENGVCEVHVLSDVPIQIQENHFAKPLERNDILNAPAHLPVPNLRFSIRQISMVWHIYGGSDFTLPKPSKALISYRPAQTNPSVR